MTNRLKTILLFIILSKVSVAQDNRMNRDSVRIKYQVLASGLIQSGNVVRTLFPTLGNISFSKSKFELRQTLNYSYGKIGTATGKRKIEDELLVRSEFALFQTKRIFPFTWGLYEESNIRNITKRWLGGAGVGLNLVTTNRHILSLRNGIAYETTNFLNIPTNKTWRYSGRLAGIHRLFNNRIILNHETYVQPSINRSEDFRYRTIIRLNVPVWKTISLTTLIDQGYETVVDLGKKKNNFFMSYGLSISN